MIRGPADNGPFVHIFAGDRGGRIQFRRLEESRRVTHVSDEITYPSAGRSARKNGLLRHGRRIHAGPGEEAFHCGAMAGQYGSRQRVAAAGWAVLRAPWPRMASPPVTSAR